MKIIDFRRFIFDKLIAPDVIKINKPGLIITKVVQKYGSQSSIIRPAYIFEDLLIDLQLETIKKIGEEKTSELWYKIGKDLISNYLVISKAKKPSRKLVGILLEYVLSRFLITGMSIEEIKFDNSKVILSIKGKNNIICRKTGIGSVHAGIVSGLVSFFIGENIEAIEKKCSYRDSYCEIYCSKEIPMIYIPNLDEIKNEVSLYEPVPNYDNPVFDNFKDLSTFNKMLKFNKIQFKNNFTYYNDKVLMTGEINISNVILYNYKKVGLYDLALNSIVRSSEKTFRELYGLDFLTIDQKLSLLRNLISIFGWGIPIIKKEKNKIIVDIIFGCSTKCESFMFYSSQIQGFLNAIYNKKINFLEISSSKINYPISRVIFVI